MFADNSEATINSVPKDIVKLIAIYAGDFFPLSSINRRFLGFFQEERQKRVKESKIFAKKFGNSAFLLTFDGKLYAMGKNRSGQFGIGGEEQDIHGWIRIGPGNKPISQLVWGLSQRTLFLRCGREWFVAGDNRNFQIAADSDLLRVFHWMSFSGPDNKIIREIIPTDSSIFVRDEEGIWYARGSNYWGQLDPEDSSVVIKDWRRIGIKNKKILEIVVRHYTTFLLHEDGWYGCGKNENGEMGVGIFSPKVAWSPMRPVKNTVLQLKATDYNTFVQCEDGQWYGCGHNRSGQLGNESMENQADWIRIAPEEKTVELLICEHMKTFAYCGEELYVCGAPPSQNGIRFDKNRLWKKKSFQQDSLISVRIGFSNKSWGSHKKYAYYLEGSQGWYRWGRTEKLELCGKEAKNIVTSDTYTFMKCEDGWYQKGSYVWAKIFSHDQNINELVSERKRLAAETELQRFKRVMRKLAEREFIFNLRKVCSKYGCAILYWGYDTKKSHPFTFHFFVPTGAKSQAKEYEPRDIEEAIKEILGYDKIKFFDAIYYYNTSQTCMTYWRDCYVDINLLDCNESVLADFIDKYEKYIDRELPLEENKEKNLEKDEKLNGGRKNMDEKDYWLKNIIAILEQESDEIALQIDRRTSKKLERKDMLKIVEILKKYDDKKIYLNILCNIAQEDYILLAQLNNIFFLDGGVSRKWNEDNMVIFFENVYIECINLGSSSLTPKMVDVIESHSCQNFIGVNSPSYDWNQCLLGKRIEETNERKKKFFETAPEKRISYFKAINDNSQKQMSEVEKEGGKSIENSTKSFIN